MRHDKLCALILRGTAILALTGCSTILRGTSEEVAVETPGMAGATCQLTGGDGVNATIATPGRVRVPKSKTDLKVTCTAPGGQIASRVFASDYSDYSYVQWPAGYLVDGVSGAMWVYPKMLSVPFDTMPLPFEPAPGRSS